MANRPKPTGNLASAPPGPQADRNFYLGVALAVTLVVAVGFGPTVNTSLFHPPLPRPRILHLHAAVFSAWVLLFVTQAALFSVR